MTDHIRSGRYDAQQISETAQQTQESLSSVDAGPAQLAEAKAQLNSFQREQAADQMELDVAESRYTNAGHSTVTRYVPLTGARKFYLDEIVPIEAELKADGSAIDGIQGAIIRFEDRQRTKNASPRAYLSLAVASSTYEYDSRRRAFDAAKLATTRPDPAARRAGVAALAIASMRFEYSARKEALDAAISAGDPLARAMASSSYEYGTRRDAWEHAKSEGNILAMAIASVKYDYPARKEAFEAAKAAGDPLAMAIASSTYDYKARGEAYAFAAAQGDTLAMAIASARFDYRTRGEAFEAAKQSNDTVAMAIAAEGSDYPRRGEALVAARTEGNSLAGAIASLRYEYGERQESMDSAIDDRINHPVTERQIAAAWFATWLDWKIDDDDSD